MEIVRLSAVGYGSKWVMLTPFKICLRYPVQQIRYCTVLVTLEPPYTSSIHGKINIMLMSIIDRSCYIRCTTPIWLIHIDIDGIGVESLFILHMGFYDSTGIRVHHYKSDMYINRF